MVYSQDLLLMLPTFISNAGTTMMGIGEKYISAGMESMVTKNGHAFVELMPELLGSQVGLWMVSG